MCNIPITKLMNVPSVGSQVEQFFDGIGQDKTPKFALESIHIHSPGGMQPSKDEKDPPVNIQFAANLLSMKERTVVTLPFT